MLSRTVSIRSFRFKRVLVPFMERIPDHSEIGGIRCFASSSSDKVIYESPFGNLVTRLRTVSLATGLCGTVGLPIVVSFKGGVPNNAFFAMSLLFLMGTWGSTAAVHFVFSPYVYRIEEVTSESSESAQAKEVLLKFYSKSLLLTSKETIASIQNDIQPYNGMRPLCNLLVKNQSLYIHPEYLYHTALREAMQLKKVKATKNPDDLI